MKGLQTPGVSKVQACDELIEQTEETYDLVARSRLDLRCSSSNVKSL